MLEPNNLLITVARFVSRNRQVPARVAMVLLAMSPLWLATPCAEKGLDLTGPNTAPATSSATPPETSPATDARQTDTRSLPAGVSKDWWSTVQKNIGNSEYNVSSCSIPHSAIKGSSIEESAIPVGASRNNLQSPIYQAPNRAHNLRAYFTAEGLRVVPRTEKEPSWVWGLELVGYNGGAAPALEATVPDGKRIEYQRGGLVEWYLNDAKGLEQGFTIAKAPLECGSHAAAFDPHSSALEQNQGASAACALQGASAACALQDQGASVARAPQGASVARAPQGASVACALQDQGASAACALQIDLAIAGNLRACVAPDGKTIEFLSEGGVSVIHYGALKAVDATGRALAARMELIRQDEPDSQDSLENPVHPVHPVHPVQSPSLQPPVASLIRLIVDAAGAQYPVTIDPLATSAAWTAESDQEGAWFGYSVSTAGDVNGDGYSDVIVGALYYDNGQDDEGRAYVYYGSASGLSATPNWTAEGDQNYAYFGRSVSTAGDVNGDGYSDVIVGAFYYDNGESDEGRVFVYHGSASGLSATPNWTAESNQVSAEFGVSVSTAGDVNGDGYSDVIVGADYYDNGQTDEGRAYVYLGSASGLSATPAWTAESDQAGALFGHSVSTAGDVNGDGYGDVIVGALNYDNGETDEGRAFVYYGSASGLSATPNWTAESDQAGAWFGVSVSTAGDVNGDGYSDVIVGAESYSNGQLREGRAFVYLGSASGLSATPAWTAESDQADARFGVSVSTAGDVNGDGYDDVIVGAHCYNNGEDDEGRAYVYLGSASGLSATPAWTAESDQGVAYFGQSVSTAGDVNGDGFSDVIVGAHDYSNGQFREGRAFVYYGSGAGPDADWTADGNQPGAQFGGALSSAGDVNGDGYSDIIVSSEGYDHGEMNEGKVFVYYGSASGLSRTPNWTAEGNKVRALFGHSASTVGDVNGDGYSDIFITEYDYTNGHSYVYYGSPTGLSTTPNWVTVPGRGTAAGDVNGDGYGDIIVGNCTYTNGEALEGMVFVWCGSPTGPNGGATGTVANADWTAETNQVNSNLGSWVSTAGDVNGDGYDDVIVGACLYDNGETDEGAAFVWLGSSSGLNDGVNGTPANATWTVEGNQAGAWLGAGVAAAGDVNGDGYSDVLVGAPYYDNTYTDEGRTYLYLGSASGLSTTPNWTANGGQANAVFGFCLDTAGDVNGDGYSDVIVGASLYSNGEREEGRAYIYHGSASGLSATPAWIGESNHPGAHFGEMVATAGDVNGDGFSDVIVSAPHYFSGQENEGRAFVYYGFSPTTISGTVTGATADTTVAAIDAAGAVVGRVDVNPDGAYRVPVPYGFSGWVAPDSASVVFHPFRRAYRQVTASKTGQNFKAFPCVLTKADLDADYKITYKKDGMGKDVSATHVTITSDGGLVIANPGTKDTLMLSRSLAIRKANSIPRPIRSITTAGGLGNVRIEGDVMRLSVGGGLSRLTAADAIACDVAANGWLGEVRMTSRPDVENGDMITSAVEKVDMITNIVAAGGSYRKASVRLNGVKVETLDAENQGFRAIALSTKQDRKTKKVQMSGLLGGVGNAPDVYVKGARSLTANGASVTPYAIVGRIRKLQTTSINLGGVACPGLIDVFWFHSLANNVTIQARGGKIAGASYGAGYYVVRGKIAKFAATAKKGYEDGGVIGEESSSSWVRTTSTSSGVEVMKAPNTIFAVSGLYPDPHGSSNITGVTAPTAMYAVFYAGATMSGDTVNGLPVTTKLTPNHAGCLVTINASTTITTDSVASPCSAVCPARRGVLRFSSR